MKIPALLIIVSLLSACGDEKKPVLEEETKEQEAPTGTVHDLSSHDIPLIVRLDHNTLGTDTPSVRWNEDIGKLEVQAGDRFSILVSEEAGDISRLKADLERDMLRKHTIIEEQQDLIIYRSTFPDDDIVFVHFYRILEHNGRTFVIESHDQGQFNESDIRRMAASVVPAKQA